MLIHGKCHHTAEAEMGQAPDQTRQIRRLLRRPYAAAIQADVAFDQNCKLKSGPCCRRR